MMQEEFRLVNQNHSVQLYKLLRCKLLTKMVQWEFRLCDTVAYLNTSSLLAHADCSPQAGLTFLKDIQQQSSCYTTEVVRAQLCLLVCHAIHCRVSSLQSVPDYCNCLFLYLPSCLVWVLFVGSLKRDGCLQECNGCVCVIAS